MTFVRSFFARLLAVTLLVIACVPPSFVFSSAKADVRSEDTGARVSLPRHPSLSPDGSKLAFSWRGDIWTVPVAGGTALRLTAHPAYDSMPRWSPDGKWIAFSSNRNGNDDVFVMSAQGGAPRQLTFYSGTDTPFGWTHDSQAVLFTASREYRYSGNAPTLYQVPITGGQPVRALEEGAFQAKMSPDGKKFVFTSGRCEWWRKRYRGAANLDLWTYDTTSKQYQKLTTHTGNDHWPMWAPDSGRIYYVSDEDKTFNLWVMKSDGTNKRKLTSFKDDGVRYPEISADGSRIAFEKGTGLFVLDMASNETKEVIINAPADSAEDPLERDVLTGHATELKVSPDGEQIAFTVRGEIYVMKKEGGPATLVVHHPARDGDMVWSPDGKTLVFVSARDGNRELYAVTSDDKDEPRLYRTLKTKLTRLTNTPEEESNPTYSPDGKKLAFVRGRGDLYVANADGTNAVRILEAWSAPQFDWSPDSQWIAYTQEDEQFNSEIFIIPATGGKAVNVSRHPDNDFSPVWSADGKTLSFTSRRLGNEFDIWFLYLRKSDDEKSKEDLEEDEKRAAKAKRPTTPPQPAAPASEEPAEKQTEKPVEKPKEDKTVKVEIDFEDIHKRVRRVTSLPGDETSFAIAPDSKTYAFASNNQGVTDLYVIQRDGTRLQTITRGGQQPNEIQWTKDQKVYFLTTGGRISTVSVPPAPKSGEAASGGGPSPSPASVSFQAKVMIDRATLRKQVFLEGWKAMNDGFYDPNFHGADWNAAREKYLDWALKASCDADFYDVFRMLLGELNSSHQGITPPGEPTGQPPLQTGVLGVVWDESYHGEGLRVARVIKGTPAAKTISRLDPGDVILKINSEPLTGNLDQRLNDTVGQRVLLEVAKGSPTGERREVVITPINSTELTSLVYDDWVEQRRRMVEEMSQGKLGYLHIRSMDQPSLDRFEQELYSEAYGKQGLVMDVRDNGGGFTTDYLLAMINVKPHAYTTARGSTGKGYPQDRLPLYFWTRPTNLLCNQYSYSNAEIFSHAFKVTKRGKLIGQQTYGAVISTGAVQLVDGSLLRMPTRGWYVYDTGMNEEHNGAMPDLVVENLPGDAAAGRDRQLERAVQELLTEIK